MAKQYDQKRGTPAERGYDKRWKAVRLSYLQDNPLCEECKRVRIDKFASIVHHIVDISNGGDQYDEDNLMSVCTACHNRLHGRGR